MTIEFNVGQTYSTRSTCNHDSIFSIVVTYRSPSGKTIKTACGKTLRVTVWEGVEQVSPCGRYSMSPTITAACPALGRSSAAGVRTESVAEMLAGEEFHSLFGQDEQGEILAVLAAALKPEKTQVKTTAQIIVLADYRKNDRRRTAI